MENYKTTACSLFVHERDARGSGGNQANVDSFLKSIIDTGEKEVKPNGNQQMKKCVFFVFVLLVCCKAVDKSSAHQFIVKTIVIGYNGKEEGETRRYFYLSNSSQKDLKKIKTKVYSENGLNSEIARHYNGKPIYHFAIMRWKISCLKHRLSFPKNAEQEKDTIEESKIMAALESNKSFKSIKVKSPMLYSMRLSYINVRDIEYCTIPSDFLYSDSMIILKKLELRR